MQTTISPGPTSLVVLLASLLALPTAAQTTIVVPEDVPTIQSAIDVAADGDTVLVLPGTYVENIELPGTNITLQSTQGAGVTTIRGKGGSVVTDVSDVGFGTLVRGFTITGGTGMPRGGRGTRADGGGVFLDGSPTFEDCIIRDNHVTGNGGGIYSSGGFETPTFRRCLITANSAAGDGGGVYHFASLSLDLRDSTVTANRAGGHGGGFASFTSGVNTFGCLIEGNVAAGSGGGGYHAGIGAIGTAGTFVRNEAGGDGGGLYLDVDAVAGPALLRDARFAENRARGSGGGLFLDFSVLLGGALGRFERCELASNVAGVDGGGMWARFVSDFPTNVELLHFSFSGNVACDAGAALYLDVVPGADATLVNSIVWGHASKPWGGPGRLAIAFSNIQGGAGGVGNIEVDPLFLDADEQALALLPGSPCIGTGIEPENGDHVGADMGAHAFAPWFDHGDAMHGTFGRPGLAGAGTLAPDSETTLALTGGVPRAKGVLVFGTSNLSVPFQQGTLVPSPDVIVPGLVLDASGELVLTLRWPDDVPPGVPLYWQAWITDRAGPQGVVASNALSSTQP